MAERKRRVLVSAGVMGLVFGGLAADPAAADPVVRTRTEDFSYTDTGTAEPTTCTVRMRVTADADLGTLEVITDVRGALSDDDASCQSNTIVQTVTYKDAASGATEQHRTTVEDGTRVTTEADDVGSGTVSSSSVVTFHRCSGSCTASYTLSSK
jgi:hypothetical protein